MPINREFLIHNFGDRTLGTDQAKWLNYADFLEGKRAVGVPQRINIQSVADSTGIPRETVRRKIRRLIERGWVKKNEDGTLEVTASAAVDLAPATQATFDYFLALGNILFMKATEASASRVNVRGGETD
ncbi:winged helix-turn-helix transcriptional regulator [Lentisalinibacter sediminis]|uniref:winged helix-turn-helix transcriptional regulator n=1 Tax=Lentisalinibacter sediminis TaxID=2992237 RepID=UPI00386C09F6